MGIGTPKLPALARWSTGTSSAAVHACVPEADGFLFVSRFTGDACVAVFDRAFGKLRVPGVDELVRHAGFLDALDDYDIVLTEPPG